MKKIILWIFNLSTLVLGLFFGIIWLTRLGLDYNAEGKYFNETNSVVYDQDALLVYGTLTLIFVVAGLIGCTLSLRIKRSTRT